MYTNTQIIKMNNRIIFLIFVFLAFSALLEISVIGEVFHEAKAHKEPHKQQILRKKFSSKKDHERITRIKDISGTKRNLLPSLQIVNEKNATKKNSVKIQVQFLNKLMKTHQVNMKKNQVKKYAKKSKHKLQNTKKKSTTNMFENEAIKFYKRPHSGIQMTKEKTQNQNNPEKIENPNQDDHFSALLQRIQHRLKVIDQLQIRLKNKAESNKRKLNPGESKYVNKTTKQNIKPLSSGNQKIMVLISKNGNMISLKRFQRLKNKGLVKGITPVYVKDNKGHIVFAVPVAMKTGNHRYVLSKKLIMIRKDKIRDFLKKHNIDFSEYEHAKLLSSQNKASSNRNISSINGGTSNTVQTNHSHLTEQNLSSVKNQTGGTKKQTIVVPLNEILKADKVNNERFTLDINLIQKPSKPLVSNLDHMQLKGYNRDKGEIDLILPKKQVSTKPFNDNSSFKSYFGSSVHDDDEAIALNQTQLPKWMNNDEQQAGFLKGEDREGEDNELVLLQNERNHMGMKNKTRNNTIQQINSENSSKNTRFEERISNQKAHIKNALKEMANISTEPLLNQKKVPTENVDEDSDSRVDKSTRPLEDMQFRVKEDKYNKNREAQYGNRKDTQKDKPMVIEGKLKDNINENPIEDLDESDLNNEKAPKELKSDEGKETSVSVNDDDDNDDDDDDGDPENSQMASNTNKVYQKSSSLFGKSVKESLDTKDTHVVKSDEDEDEKKNSTKEIEKEKIRWPLVEVKYIGYPIQRAGVDVFMNKQTSNEHLPETISNFSTSSITSQPPQPFSQNTTTSQQQTQSITQLNPRVSQVTSTFASQQAYLNPEQQKSYFLLQAQNQPQLQRYVTQQQPLKPKAPSIFFSYFSPQENQYFQQQNPTMKNVNNFPQTYLNTLTKSSVTYLPQNQQQQKSPLVTNPQNQAAPQIYTEINQWSKPNLVVSYSEPSTTNNPTQYSTATTMPKFQNAYTQNSLAILDRKYLIEPQQQQNIYQQQRSYQQQTQQHIPQVSGQTTSYTRKFTSDDIPSYNMKPQVSNFWSQPEGKDIRFPWTYANPQVFYPKQQVTLNQRQIQDERPRDDNEERTLTSTGVKSPAETGEETERSKVKSQQKPMLASTFLIENGITERSEHNKALSFLKSFFKHVSQITHDPSFWKGTGTKSSKEKTLKKVSGNTNSAVICDNLISDIKYQTKAPKPGCVQRINSKQYAVDSKRDVVLGPVIEEIERGSDSSEMELLIGRIFDDDNDDDDDDEEESDEQDKQITGYAEKNDVIPHVDEDAELNNEEGEESMRGEVGGIITILQNEPEKPSEVPKLDLESTESDFPVTLNSNAPVQVQSESKRNVAHSEVQAQKTYPVSHLSPPVNGNRLLVPDFQIPGIESNTLYRSISPIINDENEGKIPKHVLGMESNTITRVGRDENHHLRDTGDVMIGNILESNEIKKKSELFENFPRFPEFTIKEDAPAETISRSGKEENGDIETQRSQNNDFSKYLNSPENELDDGDDSEKTFGIAFVPITQKHPLQKYMEPKPQEFPPLQSEKIRKLQFTQRQEGTQLSTPMLSSPRVDPTVDSNFDKAIQSIQFNGLIEDRASGDEKNDDKLGNLIEKVNYDSKQMRLLSDADRMEQNIKRLKTSDTFDKSDTDNSLDSTIDDLNDKQNTTLTSNGTKILTEEISLLNESVIINKPTNIEFAKNTSSINMTVTPNITRQISNQTDSLAINENSDTFEEKKMDDQRNSDDLIIFNGKNMFSLDDLNEFQKNKSELSKNDTKIIEAKSNTTESKKIEDPENYTGLKVEKKHQNLKKANKSAQHMLVSVKGHVNVADEDQAAKEILETLNENENNEEPILSVNSSSVNSSVSGDAKAENNNGTSKSEVVDETDRNEANMEGDDEDDDIVILNGDSKYKLTEKISKDSKNVERNPTELSMNIFISPTESSKSMNKTNHKVNLFLNQTLNSEETASKDEIHNKNIPKMLSISIASNSFVNNSSYGNKTETLHSIKNPMNDDESPFEDFGEKVNRTMEGYKSMLLNNSEVLHHSQKSNSFSNNKTHDIAVETQYGEPDHYTTESIQKHKFHKFPESLGKKVDLLNLIRDLQSKKIRNVVNKFGNFKDYDGTEKQDLFSNFAPNGSTSNINKNFTDLFIGDFPYKNETSLDSNQTDSIESTITTKENSPKIKTSKRKRDPFSEIGNGVTGGYISDGKGNFEETALTHDVPMNGAVESKDLNT